MHDIQVELVDVAMLEPGAEASARLAPFHPDLWPMRTVGERFSIYEGKQRVADAVVLEVNL
jgi:hypothetical protein